MDERELCLAQNEELLKAINTFLKELEGDYFRNGVDACSKCQRGMDRTTAISLHLQLRAIYDTLSVIEEKISLLK